MIAKQGRERRPGLDLLRLASALAVVLFHFGFRMGTTGEGGGAAFPELSAFAVYGYLGVDVFFIISGYVIAWTAEGRTAIDFAVARVARLWPAYVTCATLTFLVLLVWPFDEANPSLFQWLAKLTMLSPALGQPFLDGAYWSIVYEIVFYGWMALALATRIYPRYIFEAIVVWLFISLANEFWLGSGVVQKLLLTDYAGLFAVGLLIRSNERQPSLQGWALLVLATVVAVMTSWVVSEDLKYRYGVSVDLTVLSLVTITAVVAVLQVTRIERLPLPSGLVLAIGGMTYPLYLLHQHIGYAAFTHLGSAVGRWTLACILLGGLFAVSFLIWRFVEPLGRRVVYAVATPALAMLSLIGWDLRRAAGVRTASTSEPG